VSRYQQGVKLATTTRLADYVQADRAWFYDYHRRLRLHQELVGPSHLEVRRFERARFVDGSLFQDFFDAVGLDDRAADWDQVELRNESLDAESVEVLRLLNLYRAQGNDDGPGRIKNDLVSRLSEAADGPTLTLPEPVLDRFMAQWEESNRRVALDLVGDPSGALFETPRKTRDTTTEQRLDPARLDHYLELLELPEPMHARFRRLVEREAATS
jgi:hypothetical protein